jgi:hypothetical protein
MGAAAVQASPFARRHVVPVACSNWKQQPSPSPTYSLPRDSFRLLAARQEANRVSDVCDSFKIVSLKCGSCHAESIVNFPPPRG